MVWYPFAMKEAEEDTDSSRVFDIGVDPLDPLFGRGAVGGVW